MFHSGGTEGGKRRVTLPRTFRKTPVTSKRARHLFAKPLTKNEAHHNLSAMLDSKKGTPAK